MAPRSAPDGGRGGPASRGDDGGLAESRASSARIDTAGPAHPPFGRPGRAPSGVRRCPSACQLWGARAAGMRSRSSKLKKRACHCASVGWWRVGATTWCARGAGENALTRGSSLHAAGRESAMVRGSSLHGAGRRRQGETRAGKAIGAGGFGLVQVASEAASHGHLGAARRAALGGAGKRSAIKTQQAAPRRNIPKGDARAKK